ncbi:MAG: hypothetical protein K2R98_05760 [Gemmataceae bacterium]|nr:hypothetical protein [Gemmataceae bacterium]
MCTVLSTLRTRPSGLVREPFRRYLPIFEQLECRNLLDATMIQLDLSGSGFATGDIGQNVNQFEFRATVTGRISIFMHSERERMHGELTSGIPLTEFPPDGNFPIKGTPVPSQIASAEDSLLQFDVIIDQTYQFYAAVPGQAGLTQFDYGGARGPYQLYLSTETSDFSATTPHVIPLDASGFGLQLGTIEKPEDQDYFAFTASATGQAFVRVGGAVNQELVLNTAPGQTFGILVSGAGPYVLTVRAVADDFPAATVTTVKLDGNGSGSQAGRINVGRINQPDDVDAFRFTAPKTGIMTITMQDDWWRFTGQLSVAPVSVDAVTYDFTGPQKPFGVDYPRILQFHVDKGVQYTVRVSGVASGARQGSFTANLGLSANYELSFTMVEDDFADVPRRARNIRLENSSGTPESSSATVSGSIETRGDQDWFKFTAREDGFVLVALRSMQETNIQGRLIFPSETPLAVIDAGPTNRTWVEAGTNVFTKVGYAALTRDEYVVIQVTRGETYEFAVSADQDTIGDYTLGLAFYNSPAVASFSYPSSVDDTLDFSIPAASISSPPVLLTIGVTFPGQPERALGGPAVTNTRLVGFPLPPVQTGTTPPIVTVPSIPSTVPNSQPGAPVVPSANGTVSAIVTEAGGPSTLGGQSPPIPNSLIATLLIVAARDNSVRSNDGAVAAQKTSDVTRTLLASLLVGVIAPGSGGGDAESAPLISGTVFADLDGNGQRNEGEPGVAGEKIVLEVQKDGAYVVMGTAVTDAKGGFAFAGVTPGVYRVCRISPAGSSLNLTTPVSYAVKVTSDSKPRVLHFGMAAKRGRPLTRRDLPSEEEACSEDLDRAVQDWNEEAATLAPLDDREPDRSTTDWGLGLLCLAPAAMLSIANGRQGGPADEDCRPTARPQR